MPISAGNVIPFNAPASRRVVLPAPAPSSDAVAALVAKILELERLRGPATTRVIAGMVDSMLANAHPR